MIRKDLIVADSDKLKRLDFYLSQKLKILQSIKDVFLNRGTEVATIPSGVWTPVVEEIIEIVRDSLREININEEDPV